jgi:hypothetical protein
MALQKIANRLIGNHIPEIGQGARNPVIAPVPVLARHANDQLLHLALDPRSTRAMTNLRAIEFASDQLAVPGQDNALFKLLSEHGSDGVPPPRRGH